MSFTLINTGVQVRGTIIQAFASVTWFIAKLAAKRAQNELNSYFESEFTFF